MSTKDKESINDLLKSFILFDVIFTTSFCFGGLIEYERDFFILVFIVITLITYYPLYLYVKDYLSMSTLKEKSWYFRHLNTALFYCVYRIFLIFVFLAIAIIDTSGIDVPHTIVHLPLLSKIILIVMIIAAFCLIGLAFRIVPFHYNYTFNTVTNANITATVTKTSDPYYLQNFKHGFVSSLNLGTAQSVYLVPSSSSEDHSLLITEYANLGFEVDDR